MVRRPIVGHDWIAFSIVFTGHGNTLEGGERCAATDARRGVVFGEYEFAPGKQQGVSLDWQPAAGGSLPTEILFVEKLVRVQ